MGYDQRELKVIARVSRHNSIQDQDDDELWEELRQEIECMVEDHYQQIGAMVV